LALPPEQLGRFEVHGEIGRGGMGAVLRGHDPTLGRDLAIKVLLASRLRDADALRRFHEEAQIGGQLQHPGLVPVYELSAGADGRPFFAMKLVDGRTLAALLKERKAPTDDLPRWLTVFEQVCQAVGYAHARGVIHRDLKPANVMVGAFGEVQVMDWGLAKVLGLGGSSTDTAAAGGVVPGGTTVRTARTESGGSESQAGAVLGTPSYMPPEQARGEIDHLDYRADVFGLGAILCEILTGQPPFTGQDVSAILGRSARGDLAETFTRLDGCGADAELVRLAKACLAAEPGARPPDGAAVAAQVAAYRAGVAERLRTAELERAAAEVRAVEERRRRRAQLALAGAVLLLLTLGGGGGWYVRQQGLKHEAEQARQETERVRQEAERTRAVEDDLNHLDRARRERKWNEAEKLLERVEGRLAQGGSDELRRRVGQARADLARVRRDQQMVARMEDAGAQRAAPGKEGFDKEGSRQRFEEAFAWYGLDVRQGTPEEVAARVADSPISEELVIALDRWSELAAPAEMKRLRAIADRVDTNAWRRRLRGAILCEDYDLVRRLAGEAKVSALPPASIAYLAKALQQAKASKESSPF
jgi:serine/threonine-protein kinase